MAVTFFWLRRLRSAIAQNDRMQLRIVLQLAKLKLSLGFAGVLKKCASECHLLYICFKNGILGHVFWKTQQTSGIIAIWQVEEDTNLLNMKIHRLWNCQKCRFLTFWSHNWFHVKSESQENSDISTLGNHYLYHNEDSTIWKH